MQDKKVCVAYIIIFCLDYFLQIIFMTTGTNCCEWMAEYHESSNLLYNGGSSQTTLLLLYISWD